MKDLTASDDVLRHVKGTLITDKGSISGEAFERRAGEDAPSYDHKQSLGTTVEEQVAELRRAFRKKLSSTHRFAELNVGEVVQALLADRKLGTRFVLDGLPEEQGPDGTKYVAQPSHTLHWGMPEFGTDESRLAGEVIASQVRALFLAKEPAKEPE